MSHVIAEGISSRAGRSARECQMGHGRRRRTGGVSKLREVVSLGVAVLLCAQADGVAADPKKPSTKPTLAVAKKQAVSLPKGEQVLAAFKKLADAEPTVLSGKIDKGMTLKGLVVIKANAQLASHDVELVPASGAIIINNSPDIFYKPVRISGIPFATVLTASGAGQKSQTFAAMKYWDATYENCIFQGNFVFDAGCTPSFSNCLFLGSTLKGCDTMVPPNNLDAKVGRYTNCLFSGFNFSSKSLYAVAKFVFCTESSGFKSVTMPKAPKADGKLILPPFKPETKVSFYDFDGNVVPALELFPWADNKKITYSPLVSATNTLPYFDKAEEIQAFLDVLAMKYKDPPAAKPAPTVKAEVKAEAK